MATRQSRPTSFDNRPARPGPRADAAQPGRGATPQANHERYLALAKARALAGDRSKPSAIINMPSTISA